MADKVQKRMKLYQWFKALTLIIGVSSLILVASVIVGQILQFVFQGDMSGWVQAVGAILAIVSGFATAAYQTYIQQRDLDDERRAFARAAHMLAFEALETISERLNTALTPKGSKVRYALRGNRTTEMVSAMREFDTARLPIELLPDFIQLRSHVFAINERISELYAKKERGTVIQKCAAKAKRHSDLASAVRVRQDALDVFKKLQDAAVSKFGALPKCVTDRNYLSNYNPAQTGIELSDR